MPRDPFEYYPISRSCCETAASVSCTGLVEAASSAMLRHTIPTRFLCFRSSVVIDAAARYPPTHTALARAVRSCSLFLSLSPLLPSTLYYTLIHYLLFLHLAKYSSPLRGTSFYFLTRKHGRLPTQGRERNNFFEITIKLKNGKRKTDEDGYREIY